MIYNTFWIPGKVPSMNDLLRAKSSTPPQRFNIIRFKGQKRNNNFVYNQYNEIKQNWSNQTIRVCKDTQWIPVESCYFNYLICEKNKKRDPSNICSSAIKFIEDGLQKAGVIPNDGWNNVLGISNYWSITNYGLGIFVILSDDIVSKESMLWNLEVFMEGKDEDKRATKIG